MNRLAINGGEPSRREPLPGRSPFGDREIGLLTEAVQSQNLFGLHGRMVTAFEEGFAGLYRAKHAVASSSGTAAIHIAVGCHNTAGVGEILVRLAGHRPRGQGDVHQLVDYFFIAGNKGSAFIHVRLIFQPGCQRQARFISDTNCAAPACNKSASTAAAMKVYPIAA